MSENIRGTGISLIGAAVAHLVGNAFCK